MLLGRQVQNGVLASFPDAARELATFAYASSVFLLVNSLLVFVPQMVNVLARSRQAHRVCLRATAGICLALCVPLAAVAFSPRGRSAVGAAFHIAGTDLDKVMLYLGLMAPLVLTTGLRQYYNGLLIQARMTGTVTLLHAAQFGVLAGVMVLGRGAGWGAVPAVAGAAIAADTLHLALLAGVYLRRYRFGEAAPGEGPLRLGEVWSYYWPTATTSLMFAVTRPVIFVYVSAMAGAVYTVAALRVAFDFAMLFHVPLNQIRHLFATFGGDDPRGVRRFLAVLTAAATAAMALVAATPVGSLVLGGVMGVSGPVLAMAGQALLVLCLVPGIIAVRNYFHGQMLTGRRTGGMAAGGILRVASLWAAAWALQSAGLLDHLWAAAVLVLGFAMEAATCLPFAARVAAARRPAGAAELLGD